MHKSITGYGSANFNSNTGYHLIANPMKETVDPRFVTNLITNPATNYDLYLFTFTQPLEWENYKASTFNLMPGNGYLYARQTNGNLIFTGELKPSNTPYPFQVSTISSSYPLDGWYLKGNPFACNAYITDGATGLSYYVMNSDGDGYIAAEGAIALAQGFFVKASSSNTQTFYLSRDAATNRPATLNINLSSSEAMRDGNSALRQAQGPQADVIDRAIVHFGEGSTLEKLTFRDDNTRLYIPQDGTDYAVVKAGTMGELPVNFKAETNGRYTIGFSSEEVEFSYLHLIDNMTRADIDLLCAGDRGSVPAMTTEGVSYTFTAKTTDYASRFKLVFAVGSSVDAETFGFVNAAGNLTIFGIEGEATLQVMDVMGHVLSTETFSGSYEKRLNVAPGVYLLRLVNSDDVKTQKVVVR